MNTKAKVAVVVGASRGIGRAVALRFAHEGMKVVLAARSSESLEDVRQQIVEAGGESMVVPVDLTDENQVARFAATALSDQGRIDVLVCCAGVAGPTGELWTLAVADWDRTFAVNVRGTFLCCRAFVPSMIERGQGSVIVIGSATGKRALHGRSAYGASKTALIGLVRTLACETGPSGVRVNLISPGPVEGSRLARVIESQAACRGLTEKEVYDELASTTFLGRVVEPKDVAAATSFLASDAAHSITGEDLNVSGGFVTY